VLLVLSAVAVIAGARERTSNVEAPVVASAGIESPLEMPPLPPGAAPIPFDEPPAIDSAPTAVSGGCNFVENGFGKYDAWKSGGGARLLVPSDLSAQNGEFRLLIHFHGSEAMRRVLAPEGLDLVIAGVDRGTGSGAYARAFHEPKALAQLIAAAEEEVATRTGAPAHAKPIVLSSWSAGYGATGAVLASPALRERIDGVVLLDSLYASYHSAAHDLSDAELGPFLGVARAAVAGHGLFVLTHTDVPTFGYASTAEVARHLLKSLGVTAPAPENVAAGGLRYSANQGHFVVRGYAGGDGPAHCNQLRNLPAIVRERVMTL
jgi:hypothetical protein